MLNVAGCFDITGDADIEAIGVADKDADGVIDKLGVGGKITAPNTF